MTKNELTKIVAKKTGLTQAQSAAAYDALIETITEALQEGDKVSLIGFGTFELKDVPEKEGINPATGEKIKIAASKKPSFKAGNSYKDQFNK